MADRCGAVCRHSAVALHRSLAHEEMPLHSLSRLLDRSAWVKRIRHQPLTLLFAALLAAVLLLLAAVPVPLRVEATGTLQPRTQRHLFAPSDAVVERLLVREAGEDVSADQELIQLRDPELQYEIERVLGELETARKQLAGIEAERIRADRASRSDLRDAAQRSAEEESLKKQLEGLERQQELLETRREKLNLRSPIDGQLLTWNAEQLLRSRPVGRGQILLTVADLRGPWVLELEIPDDRIADVTRAVSDRERPLDAHFILATAPETRYSGKLESIAPATDVRSDRGPTVFAVVGPDDQATMQTLRPGASVVAKIDCGRRSLLYVMTRGLLRAIRSRVLF
jgi:multidrug efflux pump subunit AcrA (membrane-fusion protein)